MTGRRDVSGRCRRPKCRAPVYWLAHEQTGRVHPINQQPSVGGNVRIDLRAGTYGVVGRRDAAALAANDDDEARATLRLSHWLTCADPPPRRAAPTATVPVPSATEPPQPPAGKPEQLALL